MKDVSGRSPCSPHLTVICKLYSTEQKHNWAEESWVTLKYSVGDNYIRAQHFVQRHTPGIVGNMIVVSWNLVQWTTLMSCLTFWNQSVITFVIFYNYKIDELYFQFWWKKHNNAALANGNLINQVHVTSDNYF